MKNHTYSKLTVNRSLPSFSLIEIMVVIAVIGVLAAVAVPSYRTYIIRSKIVNAINIAKSYQIKVGQYYDRNGSTPPSNFTSGDFQDISNPAEGISIMRWHQGNSAIELWIEKIASDMNSNAINNQVWLRFSESNEMINWECGTHNSVAYRINCDYLPSTCRLNC